MANDWKIEKKYRHMKMDNGLCISHSCYNKHRPDRQKCQKCAVIANERERNRRVKDNYTITYGNTIVMLTIKAVTVNKLMKNLKDGEDLTSFVEEIVEVAVEAMDNDK